MNIDQLLKEGKIHRFEAKRDEINKSLEIAKRDLSLAEKILEDNLDWCFSIAYNAVFQASRAYMFSLGYRPATAEVHKTVFEFLEATAEASYKDIIAYFDRARKKRHRTLYNEVGVVTRKEAQELLQIAKGFITDIEKKVR